METLKGYVTSVKFSVPSTLTAATFKVYRGDTQIGGNLNATITNSVAIAALPYEAVTQDGDIRVVLNFTFQSKNYDNEKIVTVATPYLDLWEVKAIIGTDATDEEAFEAEAAARHIINAHCGQNFGFYAGAISVTGSGEATLRLPRRLISYTDINGNAYWTNVLALRGGGWFLQSKTYAGPPSIRADFHGWHYEPDSGVITPPPTRDYALFARNYEYLITGNWGWTYVPDPVREAAKLLVNDYACGDSLYRDRLLTSMTAADWRIQFHEGAFSNTGNVRANQLLGEYVLRRGWVVI